MAEAYFTTRPQLTRLGIPNRTSDGESGFFLDQAFNHAAITSRNPAKSQGNTMTSIRTLLAILLLAAPQAFAQSADSPHVVIQAQLQQTTPTTGTLTIHATIQSGLHIYAQSQPKPFLATRFDLVENAFAMIGPFTPNTAAQIHRHPQLEVDLHEHEGNISWTAPITSRGAGDFPTQIQGSVFAQACEADRCYAPQTYPFVATLTQSTAAVSNVPVQLSRPGGAPPPADLMIGNTPNPEAAGAFQLEQIEVEDTRNNTRSVWNVLPLAFFAGLLLNFMPCVLPVVGLKLLSFIQQADSDRKQILLMNLAYTGGLLTVMFVLATLAVFAGLGWGEQFSSATFTVTLSAVVFAFGLSFLGVWELPLPSIVGDASGKANQEGYAGAFSKGILSTLLATPCSGPFLGAALAWAVTQPTYLTYAVFGCVGVGMASPYLIVGMFPSLTRWLPKPGAWMIWFKQIMGFVMLGTVVYLMSFMPIPSVVPTVLLLLGIGVALWFAGHTPVYASFDVQFRTWGLAAAMILGTVSLSFGWLDGIMQQRFERAAQRWTARHPSLTVAQAKQPNQHGIVWEDYSAAKLEELIRSGKPVFVDFTADWCLTCKSNEAAAIDTPEVAAALAAGQVVALRADKTAPNPEVDRLLRQLGNAAASIPYYAFFSADSPGRPIVFDGVYTTPQPFVSAIQKAAKPVQKASTSSTAWR